MRGRTLAGAADLLSFASGASAGGDMGSLITHPLAGGVAPAWASEWGEDKHGPFASLVVKGVAQRMRWLPPVEFTRGSPEDEEGRWDDEEQQVVQITRGFWIADTPCTQAMWAALMGSQPSEFEGERRPVESVSWDDVQGFCERLNRSPDAEVFRLPTDAEWEYACRAGTVESHYGIARGIELSEVAWYDDNSEGRTHDVAGKEPNSLGLFDTLGNVDEWMLDHAEFDSEKSRVEIDRSNGVDPVSLRGSQRVIRGGSWRGTARGARAAYRDANEPGIRDGLLGFRLARGQDVRSREGAGSRGAGRAAEPEPGGSKERAL